MIRKYQIGMPMNTEAVVKEFPSEMGAIPYLKQVEEGKFTYTMGTKDVVYGLGENVRGINKRGWIYESKCSDDYIHTEEKSSLYAAHNFMVMSGEETFGIFIDFPGIISFDVGYTNLSELVITATDINMDIYIIEGENVKAIVKEFRGIIGRSYIPPKWGMGFGQSRWSYMNSEEVRQVARQYQEKEIPLDSIYLDIDYMEDYKDFTVHTERFGDLPELISDLKKEGIRLVPIIDAGVKIEKGYDVYEEGVEKGYFCKEKDGSDFVAAVWPGHVHFPDVLNEKARKWFGHRYKVLLEQGIEGFWNDMNEPSIFYTKKRLQSVLAQMEEFKGQDLDLNDFWKFTGLVSGLSNNTEDYKEFYHNIEGESVRHDKVHNLFGYNMTRAAGEAFEDLEPEKRILLFSRSSYIGMHRYGGIWMGDNMSWWSHILLNLKMLPSVNMCGFLYSGADIGGFGTNATEDLVLRWTQLGIFTPLMRNHAAFGTRQQEAYQFENTQAFKNMIGIRYGLMPYLYSEYMKAALNDEMYFKPLAFDYPEDEFVVQVEDQLLLGESIMIAPVYTQNATGRYFYLPETMKMVKMKSMTDRIEKVLEKGHHYTEIAIDEVVIFIRPEKIVPYTLPAKNTSELDESKLEMMHFVTGKAASYELYNDDGFSKDYANKANYSTITVSN